MVSTRKLVIMGFLTLVLMVGLFSVNEKQEIRKGAEGGPMVSFLPVSENIALGETIVSTFYLDTKGKKMVGMDVKVSYDKDKLKAVEVKKGAGVGLLADFLNSDNNFVYSHINEEDGTIDLSIFSSEEDLNKIPDGILSLFFISFEAKRGGVAKVSIVTDYDNLMVEQLGTDLNVIEIDECQEATYSIVPSDVDLTPTLTPMPTPTVVDETGVVLNFKMAFTGLKDKEAVCFRDIPVRIIVMGGGSTMIYPEVVLTSTEDTTEDGEVIFMTSLPIRRGYSESNNAVFVRGPEYLQIKYGVDGQDDYYNKEGGEISLGVDRNETVYDFSKYPILAGDVTGETAGVSDGRIDGRDFVYIKSKISVEREDFDSDEVVSGDFDGDCMVGNVDLAIMMMSLVEKMAQLY